MCGQEAQIFRVRTDKYFRMHIAETLNICEKLWHSIVYKIQQRPKNVYFRLYTAHNRNVLLSF